MPSSPSSPSFFHMSAGNSLLASISAARGASSASHMRFTVSRSASKSSVRWVSNSKGSFSGDESVIIAFLGALRRAGASFGGHADGAVEADHLAVQDLVLDDVAHQSRVFLGLAEARRKRNLGAQRGAHLLAHPLQHRRVPKPRLAGHHPNAELAA